MPYEVVVESEVLAQMLVQFEVDQFYTREAALLDDRQFSAWVQLFTDDTHYFMPIRRTRSRREMDREFTKPGEMAFFDDSKPVLESRVNKLLSGTARRIRRRGRGTLSPTCWLRRIVVRSTMCARTSFCIGRG